MEKELEVIKQKYLKLQEDFGKEINAEKQDKIQKEMEIVKDQMKGKLLAFKRESQEKIKKAKLELKAKREKVTSFAGEDVLEYKAKIIKIKDELNLKINLEEDKKSPEVLKMKEEIEKISNQIKQIDGVDKSQKALNNYHDSQKKIFEDYRITSDITGLYFDYKKEEPRKESYKEKDSKQDKEEQEENNKENKEEQEKDTEENKKSTAYDEILLNVDDFEEDPEIANFLREDGNENKENSNTNQEEQNQNQTQEQGPEQESENRDLIYNDPNMKKNTKTYSFKNFLRLTEYQKRDYYMCASEAQIDFMIEGIKNGLEDGTIREEEVINFRRLTNVVKKDQLAKAKVTENLGLRKPFKEMTNLKVSKIEESLYGLKGNGKFLGIAEKDDKFIIKTTNTRLNTKNPADVASLKEEMLAKYGDLYNKMITKAYEDNINFNNRDFRRTPEGRFIISYNEYLDKVAYLTKMEDMESKFRLSGIDEYITEEYRKKHVFKGNFMTNEELLAQDTYIRIKPKFTERVKEKLLGRKFMDKTPDKRFRKVINQYKHENENRNNAHDENKNKFFRNLNSRTRTQEEAEQFRNQRENDLDRTQRMEDDIER